ncbi:MAG: ABC-F family ATP-binding cassette domain-containing protein [Bacteroidota bacterium]|jgi:ATP-binding cassette subfamily F protein uup
MNLLSVENLSKSYAAKTLFTNLSFGISKGDKLALIARNGAGKTTLINIIKGIEIPDEGTVTIRKGIKVSFLEQDPGFNPEKTVFEIIHGTETPIRKLVDDYNKILQLSEENPNDKNLSRLNELTGQMSELNAWDYENKLKEILFRLKIQNTDQKVKTLSGGQQKRLALAQLLIDEPDLLVLDEPTNHLDVEMIEWLEHYLINRDVSLLLVTHDRYFLDAVCNHIVEIDSGKLFHYAGNFNYYLEKKAERESMAASEFEKAKNLYRRELEWVRKSPRARGTKQKARTDAFYKVEEKIKNRRKEREIELNVKMSRMGGKILELIHLKKAFGEKKILNHFDYVFKSGEKIGIVGRNGTGKSTFLNMILGREMPDSGKVQTGETIVFGYYSQAGLKLPEDKRVIEFVKDFGEFIPMANGTKLSASQLLQVFNFPPDVQYGFVSKLSGGERRRLYLMSILIQNPNFLILDEPTNDLDIATLQALEEFLQNFKGCILIVSHDRYFMDKLVDHIFAFEGDGVIKDFPGSYSEYREWKELEDMQKSDEHQEEIQEELVVIKEEVKANTTPTKKLSFKEKFELESLEKDIAKLEVEKSSVENLLAVESDHAKLNELSGRFAELNSLIEAKTLRWLELSEQ